MLHRLILFPTLLGTLLLSGCTVVEYADGPAPVRVNYVDSGYYGAPVYYVYGNVPYYYVSGRYFYYSGGTRCYVNTLPHGGYYHHGNGNYYSRPPGYHQHYNQSYYHQNQRPVPYDSPRPGYQNPTHSRPSNTRPYPTQVQPSYPSRPYPGNSQHSNPKYRQPGVNPQAQPQAQGQYQGKKRYPEKPQAQ